MTMRKRKIRMRYTVFPIIGLAKLNYSKRNAALFPDPSVFGSGACKSGRAEPIQVVLNRKQDGSISNRNGE